MSLGLGGDEGWAGRLGPQQVLRLRGLGPHRISAVRSTTSDTHDTSPPRIGTVTLSLSQRGFVLASGGGKRGCATRLRRKPSPAVMQNAVLARPAPPADTASAARGGAGGSGGGAGVVMVKLAALVACLTCKLCGRLLRDPATITECLHTFCRKCISEEFIDKENCYCPTCNIDLGCAPEEKLRVYHSLLYVRSKIFPFKRRKVEVEDQEVISPIVSPIKRKERSLSSLTVHGPQVSLQKCLTKRRTKAPSLRSFSLGSKDATKKVGGWKPLASHIRVGKERKSLKSGSEDVNRSGIKSGDPDDGAPSSQAKSKEHPARYGNLAKKTGTRKVFTLKGKKKRFKAKQPRQKSRLRALWFYLVAAFDQKGQPPLPQLPTKILRIKDVDLPASFIQKYLVQKLNLSSEAAVELMCGGKTVDPAVTLHDLADSWLDKGPKGRVRSAEGAPATGFITTLFYSRPELPSPLPPPDSHNG